MNIHADRKNGRVKIQLSVGSPCCVVRVGRFGVWRCVFFSTTKNACLIASLCVAFVLANLTWQLCLCVYMLKRIYKLFGFFSALLRLPYFYIRPSLARMPNHVLSAGITSETVSNLRCFIYES